MAKKRTGESLKDLFKKEMGGKEVKRQRGKALRCQDVKTSKSDEKKPRHTIYLSPEMSRKLRVYAAEHRVRLNQVIEKLINENL